MEPGMMKQSDVLDLLNLSTTTLGHWENQGYIQSTQIPKGRGYRRFYSAIEIRKAAQTFLKKHPFREDVEYTNKALRDHHLHVLIAGNVEAFPVILATQRKGNLKFGPAVKAALRLYAALLTQSDPIRVAIEHLIKD